MSDNSNTTKSGTSKAVAEKPSGADGKQANGRGPGVTWADLTVDAILAHLRSILRGLRDKGVPVTLVRTDTGVVITITLAQLAKPIGEPSAVSRAPAAAPAEAPTRAGA